MQLYCECVSIEVQASGAKVMRRGIALKRINTYRYAFLISSCDASGLTLSAS